MIINCWKTNKIMKNSNLKMFAFALFLIASLWCTKSHAQIDTSYLGKTIRSYDIKHPEIVKHQALLESGNFNPNINSSWVHYNNPFGFRLKSCITKGNSKGFMTFDNLEHAIEYYEWWQSERYTDTNENYYDFLTRVGYAQSPNYIKNLKKYNHGSSGKMK